MEQNFNDYLIFYSFIPSYIYKKYFTYLIKKNLLEFTNLNKSEECSITLSKYRKGYLTPCNHSFSKKALDKWLKNNFTCPLCRKNLLNFTENQ